jgi:hypothetical protein
MKKSASPVSCNSIHNRVVGGKIRFDLEVQRREVWTLQQKQKLMDSLIHDWPIPPLFFVDKDDSNFWALDGQQRCRAITEFMDGGFKLSDSIKPYIDETDGSEIEVAGMHYEELPKNVKTDFNSRNVNSYNIKFASEEEIAEMFTRLNGGTPMKRIELTRVHAGADAMRFVNELSNHDFFAKKTALTDRSRIHFADHDAIFQCLALLNDEEIGFSGREIEEFAVSLKDDLKPEFKEKAMATAEYLNEVFDRVTKYLKKGSIPVVFYVANVARERGVDPIRMLEFFNEFFLNLSSESEYTQTLTKDSAKKAQVRKRLDVILEAFNKAV